MGLILRFVHPSKPAKELGPFKSVHLDAEAIRTEPRAPPFATYRDHQWQIAEERYFRFNCITKVSVQFERNESRSRSFGPYQHFSVVDGVAYAEDRVFASVDTRVGHWYCFEDGRHWHVMIITDASSETRGKLVAFLASLAPLLPGVYELWNGDRLLYVGRATGSATLRARLLAHVNGEHPISAEMITRCAWHVDADPMQCENQLLVDIGRSVYENVLVSRRAVASAGEIAADAKRLRARACQVRRLLVINRALSERTERLSTNAGLRASSRAPRLAA